MSTEPAEGTRNNGYIYLDHAWRKDTSATQSALDEISPLSGVSASGSIADIIKSVLKYSPEFTSQGYASASQYAPLYQSLLQGMLSKERAANLGDVSTLAPQLQGIRSAASLPQTNSIREMLLNQIMNELSMGSKLTPEQETNVNEYSRSAELARGFGMGSGSANRESVTKALEGMKLLESRQGKASAALAQEDASSPNPFSTILNMPTTTTTTAAGMSSAPTSNLLSFMGQNYWNANNASTQAAMYNAQLALSKAQLQEQSAKKATSKNIFGY